METLFKPNKKIAKYVEICSTCCSVFSFYRDEAYLIDSGPSAASKYYVFYCPECETKITKVVL